MGDGLPPGEVSLTVSNRSGSCPTKNPFGQQQERPFLSGQCCSLRGKGKGRMGCSGMGCTGLAWCTPRNGVYRALMGHTQEWGAPGSHGAHSGMGCTRLAWCTLRNGAHRACMVHTQEWGTPGSHGAHSGMGAPGSHGAHIYIFLTRASCQREVLVWLSSFLRFC